MLDNPQNLSNTVNVDITQEMEQAYLGYAMSVIVNRALPDVRDGLKPVHRRILYAMHESGYHSNKPHRKSARVVGDVIGKYHPHGDSAIYDSMVRMAQEFSLRLKLIDGHGNFGSIDGDSAASMRYTEARLAKVSHSMLHDLAFDTVDFRPNYDNSEHEPTVLPSVFPNILVNGSGGIAVGMATNIPPHNLGEVVDGCCAYLDNNDITIDELSEIIKGPDFPTGSTIIGIRAIKNAYNTGKGIILVRGVANIEENKGRESIIITEIPYMVNKAKMVERIAELVRDKKIEGISDLRDESNMAGIRVVVEVKRDVDANVVLNQIYSYTQLQTSFGINMLALDKGQPKLMNLKEIIVAFITFRKEVVNRRVMFLLREATSRINILIGLRVAIDNIDEVISIIRGSRDAAHAKEQLLAKRWQIDESIVKLILLTNHVNDNISQNFKFTEEQVKAILEMRLQRLTGMEKEKVEQELTKLAEDIKEYLAILNSEDKLLTIIKDELIKIKNDFSTPRLTQIEEQELGNYDIEDLINREDMLVTVTLGGYIKRVHLSTYKAQNRGGKGRMAVATMDEVDAIVEIFVGSTHTPMLFFSDAGQVYYLKLYKLPLGTPQSKGKALVNLLPLKPGERITNILALPENQDEWQDLYILFATSSGGIRRNSLTDFSYIPSNGKIAIRLEDTDSLVGVRIAKEEDHIFLASFYGKAIRFPISKLRVFKSRSSDGVIGMRLAEGDKIVGMTVLNGTEASAEKRELYLTIPLEERKAIALGASKSLQLSLEDDSTNNLNFKEIEGMAKDEQFILSVTEKGYGKCTSAYQYRVTNRGGSGITNLAISKKTGNVVTTMPILNSDELIIITNGGKMIRSKLDNVRITGRNTSGVILFKTSDKEKVVSASLVVENENLENSQE